MWFGDPAVTVWRMLVASGIIPKSIVRTDLYPYHRTTWCIAKDTDFDLFQDLDHPS